MSTTLIRQIHNFTDFDFVFNKHPVTTNLLLKKDINAIKQSILNLLTLRVGDKPFHPEIASPIPFYLFDNYSLIDDIVLEGEIKKYIETYEPRVLITSVIVTPDITNTIDFYITGIIQNTSEPFTVNLLVERLR